MTDEIHVANFDPKDIAALSPEGRAHFQSLLDKSFGTGAKDAIDARANNTTFVQRDLNAGTITHVGIGDGSLTLSQELGGYRALILKGSAHIAQQAYQDAKARGYTDEQLGVAPGTIAAPPKLNDDVGNALSPPASPDQYNIKVPAGVEVEEAADFIGEVKAGFFEVGVPAAMAGSLAQSLFDTANSVPDGADASDPGFILQVREEGAALKRMAGWEKIAANAAEFQKLLPAALRKTLEEAWAFHSAKSQVEMSNAYEAIMYRKGKK